MKDWEYTELIESVLEDYEEFSSEGLRPGQAAERCLVEYCSALKDGYTETAVIYTTLGLLLSENAEITKEHFELFSELLNSFDSKKEQLTLTEDETEKLTEQVQKLKAQFASVTVM